MKPGSRGSRGSLVLAALVGALAALAFFPQARTTLVAQCSLAVGRSPEWLSAVLGGPRERLERLAAARPQDVELQMAMATLPPLRPRTSGEDDGSRLASGRDDAGTILRQLALLSRRFPRSAVVRAHQLRHMARSAVWLSRPEQRLDEKPLPAGSMAPRQPRKGSLRQFDAIAAEGGRLDPDNGFFDGMRAAVAFADRRDEEALRHLHRAGRKPRWDDYAIGETRAKWALTRSAYGERGALQMYPFLSDLLLPHFTLLRGAAQMALWHAAQRERAVDAPGARALRADIIRLGAQIADGSEILIGKNVGIDIFHMGLKQVPPEPRRRIPTPKPSPAAGVTWRYPSPEEEARDRAARRERYAALLTADGDAVEAAWVLSAGERLEAVKGRIRRAMPDYSNETLLVLLRLVSWWMFGVIVLWQILALLAVWVLARLLARRPDEDAVPPDLGTWGAISLLVFLAPLALITPIRWTDLLVGADLLLLYATFFFGMLLVGILALCQSFGRRARRREPLFPPHPTSHIPHPSSVSLASLAAAVPTLLLFSLIWTARELDPSRTYPSNESFLVAATFHLLANVMMSVGPFRNLYYLMNSDPLFEPNAAFLVLVVFPLLLLAFVALCRVAARNLPLRWGMAEGLRRTVPFAALLLAALYLVSLAPTVVADRAAETHLEQVLTDELGVLQASR